MTDLTVRSRLSSVTNTPDNPKSKSDSPASGEASDNGDAAKRPYGTGTLRQRGPDRWQLRVRLANPDGGPNRQVTKTVVGTRDEAERALARFVVSAQVDDLRGRGGDAALTAVVEGYLQRCANMGRAPMTIYGYRQEWAKVVDDLGDRCPSTLRTKWTTDYLNGRRKSGMPASTINAIVRMLRAACNWAVGQEMITRHPFGGVELLPTANTPTEAPSDEQVASVFAQALDDDPPLAVAVRLAAVLASRRGEVPAQCWSDIDFDGHRVRRHAAVSAPPRPRDADGNLVGTAQVVVRQTKTHVDTWHPVDAVTIELLRGHRAVCDANAAEHGVALDGESFIFSNEPDGSRPWRPDAVTKRVRDVAERVPGAEGVRPKHLRKWAATILATEATAAVAQARLDHADPQTTLKHYVARNEAAEREAADRLGGHFDENSDAA